MKVETIIESIEMLKSDYKRRIGEHDMEGIIVVDKILKGGKEWN